MMRLRSARADIDIQEFKEEVAPIRHLLSFFRLLNDDNMGNEELSTAVLRYYKYALDHTLRQDPFQRFIDRLIDLALQGGNAEGGPIATFLRLKSDNPDALFENFSTILQQLYNSEKDSDPTLLESRLRALCAFAPLRAILPSPEEAAAQTKKGSKSKGKKKQALAA
ncbi:MAG: hypothetical protein ACKVJG_07640 [Candidatus Latescibacterota bacterium]